MGNRSIEVGRSRAFGWRYQTGVKLLYLAGGLNVALHDDEGPDLNICSV